MKNIIATFLLITTALFSASASSMPADPLKAAINDQMAISLPADQALVEWYVLDITELAFVSQDVLNQFCTNFSEANFIMTGNLAENKITIQVLPLRDSTGNFWDAARWNEYMVKRAPKMAAFMDTMNK